MKSTFCRKGRALLGAAIALGASLAAGPALAATFDVNDTRDLPDASVADGICRTRAGTCTLRAAVMQANATPGGDAIWLQSRAVYKLNRSGVVDNTALWGDLDVVGSLSINVRPAGSRAAIHGPGVRNDGIFHVLRGSTLSISNVTIDQLSGGVAISGVGLRVEPNATVRMIQSTITRCVTGTNGAGIMNSGSVTLVNSAVTQNRARFSNGGGAFNAAGATLTMARRSFITGNSADASGGGVYNRGALSLQLTAVENNSARESGGGIYHDTRQTSLLDVTMRSNRAQLGSGGAVFSRQGAFTISRSTLAGNQAGMDGGGVANQIGSRLDVANSTMSRNLARQSGGAIWNRGALRTFNVTIAQNVADRDSNGSGAGGGIFNAPAGAARLTHTILAGNSRRVVAPAASDCRGTILSTGHNLVTTIAGCGYVPAGGDLIAPPGGAMLAGLANNGGPTPTHALLPRSPAVDGGAPGGCRDQSGSLLTVDQRGFPRPRDGDGNGSAICDIGSFERQ